MGEKKVVSLLDHSPVYRSLSSESSSTPPSFSSVFESEPTLRSVSGGISSSRSSSLLVPSQGDPAFSKLSLGSLGSLGSYPSSSSSSSSSSVSPFKQQQPKSFQSLGFGFGFGFGSDVKSIDKIDKGLDLLSFSVSSAPLPRASPLADCPIYYEPNSSFLANNKTPSAVLESLLLQLTKRQVIHQILPLKNKIKCLTHSCDDSSPCKFVISLFKAPQNTKKANILVEVQRRHGCIVLFRRFYSQILQALTTEGVAIPISSVAAAAASSSTTSTTSPSAGTPLPYPTTPPSSSILLDKEAVDALFRSIGNPSKLSTVTVESLRETMRIFVTVSKTSQNKLALVSSDSDRSKLIEIILNALQLSDYEVRRCGATLLSNMASVESLRSELVSQLSGCMFDLLENNCGKKVEKVVDSGFTHTSLSSSSGSDSSSSSGSLIETEIQRQIAQALATLTQTHAMDVSRQPNYLHYLQILNNQRVASDDLFRDNVQKTLQQLPCF